MDMKLRKNILSLVLIAIAVYPLACGIECPIKDIIKYAFCVSSITYGAYAFYNNLYAIKCLQHDSANRKNAILKRKMLCIIDMAIIGLAAGKIIPWQKLYNSLPVRVLNK